MTLIESALLSLKGLQTGEVAVALWVAVVGAEKVEVESGGWWLTEQTEVGFAFQAQQASPADLHLYDDAVITLAEAEVYLEQMMCWEVALLVPSVEVLLVDLEEVEDEPEARYRYDLEAHS